MIKFENISKSFGATAVIKNVSLQIPRGKLVVLIGKSGCGKTTLLKMINRLIEPSGGKIFFADKDIKTLNLINLRRKTGYVIQQTGLFPHMTVSDNIGIIPASIGISEDKNAARVQELLEMVGLNYEDYKDRYPNDLSGGQQQRVGFARALANDPDVILMDEPFSALDPITRCDLQEELRKLQQQMQKTIVFVTHDMDEAIKIADLICVMRGGVIAQYDTPENILKNPADEFVANFVGKHRIWSSPEFIKIADIMIENPVTCREDQSALYCLERMRRTKVDSLLVVEPGSGLLKGIVRGKAIVPERDLHKPAAELMQTDFLYLKPEDNILTALKLVNENHVANVPVINEFRHLVGLVTTSTLVTTLSQQYAPNMEVANA